MKRFSRTLLLSLPLAFVGASCEGDSDLEDAAEDVQDAAEDAADNVKDAVEDVGDGIEDATDG